MTSKVILKLLKDIVDDRPYGVVVEIDKPEDCTLSIQNLSDPVLVTSEMSDDVGAILVDPATDTDEIYILPKGTGIKFLCGQFLKEIFGQNFTYICHVKAKRIARL